MNKIIPGILLTEKGEESSVSTLPKWLCHTLVILKYHITFRFSLLSCISGVDLASNKYRFSIVYELLSLSFNTRFRVKVFLNELDFIASATTIFINADWWEREIWDMFGIFFKNHSEIL